jgi:hypothetical protein
MTPRALCLVIAWLAIGQVAEADTLLRWKLKAGDRIKYVLHQKMDQQMNLGSLAIDVKIRTVMDVSWHVQSVDDRQVASMTTTVDRIRTRMESPQYNVEYDSDSDEEPTGIAAQSAKMLSMLVKKPIAMKIDARGRASEVQLPPDLAEWMHKATGGEKMQSLAFETGMIPFPEEAVSKGKTWPAELAIANAVVGKTVGKVEYEYAGTETKNGKQLEKILVTLDMKSFPGGGEEIAMELKSHETTGVLYFDNAAGRAVEDSSTSKMEIEVTIGDQKGTVKIAVDTKGKAQ